MYLNRTHNRHLMLKVFLPMVLSSFILIYYVPWPQIALNSLWVSSFLGCFLLLRIGLATDQNGIQDLPHKQWIAFVIKLFLLLFLLYAFIVLVTHHVASLKNTLKLTPMTSLDFVKFTSFYVLTAFLYRRVDGSSHRVITIGGLLESQLPASSYRKIMLITCNYFIRIMQIVSLILTVTAMTITVYGLFSKTQIFVSGKVLILMVISWMLVNVMIYSKPFLMLLRILSIKKINLMVLLMMMCLLLLSIMLIGDEVGLLVASIFKQSIISPSWQPKQANYFIGAWTISMAPLVGYQISQWTRGMRDTQVFAASLFVLCLLGLCHSPAPLLMTSEISCLMGFLFLYAILYKWCSDPCVQAMLIGQAYIYNKPDKRRTQVVAHRYYMIVYTYCIFTALFFGIEFIGLAAYVILLPTVFFLLGMPWILRFSSHEIIVKPSSGHLSSNR